MKQKKCKTRKCKKIKNRTPTPYKKKGGHKMHYDYDFNVKHGTISPIKSKMSGYPYEWDCLSCSMKSLKYMDTFTAEYMARLFPKGVILDIVIYMLDKTFGPGHFFKPYSKETIPDLKEYLPQGMATLACYGRELKQGDEWGHYFIVFHALNDKLYAIDAQNKSVTLLDEYLDTIQWEGFSVLHEPDTGEKVRAYITPETITETKEHFKWFE
jgi:hypothetical protein